MPVHLWFDLAGYALATGTYLALRRRHGSGSSPLPAGFGLFYLICASSGAMIGSVLFGTLNLQLSGIPDGLGKSVLGALVGGIVAIELMKGCYGIRGSTGGLLVPGIALGIAVGRLGCFAAGLEDHTHGIATSLPLGHDFGDGVLRHPVQLYEAAAMALFAAGYLVMLSRRPLPVLAQGFYLFAGFYALQRFGWEFLKPYGTLALSLNLFHWLCLALLCYGLIGFRVSTPVQQEVTAP